MTIDPADLAFERGPDLPSLSPRLTNTKRRLAVLTPEQRAANSKRGKNNRARGAKAERELARIFEAEGWTVVTQAGPNRRDMLAREAMPMGRYGWYSVECKSLVGRWPRPAEVKKAWEQAVRQAAGGVGAAPLLVFCNRSKGGWHNPTLWKVYWPDGNQELREWL